MQIYYVTFLPNGINIGQNLTKLLQKYRGPVFIETQCLYPDKANMNQT